MDLSRECMTCTVHALISWHKLTIHRLHSPAKPLHCVNMSELNAARAACRLCTICSFLSHACILYEVHE